MEEKRLLGSRQSWEAFGPMVAAAAWAMGLFGVAAPAFIGDGAENNWTRVCGECFSSFTPILDFIHALSYVYAAAHAGCTKTTGWLRYRAWIRLGLAGASGPRAGGVAGSFRPNSEQPERGRQDASRESRGQVR